MSSNKNVPGMEICLKENPGDNNRALFFQTLCHRWVDGTEGNLEWKNMGAEDLESKKDSEAFNGQYVLGVP